MKNDEHFFFPTKKFGLTNLNLEHFQLTWDLRVARTCWSGKCCVFPRHFEIPGPAGDFYFFRCWKKTIKKLCFLGISGHFWEFLAIFWGSISIFLAFHRLQRAPRCPGALWGSVVAEEALSWRLDTGHVAKKASENVRLGREGGFCF